MEAVLRIRIRLRILLSSNKNSKKNTDSYYFAVWQIRDVYPESRILIFTHPGSRISDPGSKNSNKKDIGEKK